MSTTKTRDIILKSRRLGGFFLRLLLVYALFIIFSPSLQGGLILLLLINLGWWIYDKVRHYTIRLAEGAKHNRGLLISTAFIIVIVHVVAWLYHWFGAWGFLGLVLISVVYTGFLLARQWPQYIEAKHTAERYLFGGKTIKEKYEKKEDDVK